MEQTTTEARAQRETAADVAALGDRIVASYEREREADAAATTVFTPAKTERAGRDLDATIMFPASGEKAPEASAEPSLFDDDATAPVKLADLKFGRNYNGEE